VIFRMALTAVARGPMHTRGPGRVLPLVDTAIEVDARGNPIIPGSSVRGRVRAHFERLVRALGQPVCRPPRPETMCPHVDLGREDGFCLACQVFGSAWLPGSVAFDDLTMPPELAVPNLLPVRTGVSVNRKLASAEAKRLLVVEVADPTAVSGDLQFEGEVTGDLSRLHIGWLLAAIRMVTCLGGGKARGFGEVSLAVHDLAEWDASAGRWHPVEIQPLIKEALDASP